MICPHCRNESISSPCPDCGWERTKSLRWAAEEWETQDKWARAAVYWNELSQFDPGEMEVRRRWARCVVMGSLAGLPEYTWEIAEGAVGAVVREQPEWEDGHQLRIRLWEKYGKFSALEERYLAEGSVKWARLVGLAQKFKEDHAWKKENRGWGIEKGDWFFLLGTVTFWVMGWLVARGATEEGAMLTMFTSMTLMTAGLMFLIVFAWSLRKRFSKSPAEGNAPRHKLEIHVHEKVPTEDGLDEKTVKIP